jgi:hypothetical protein
VMEKILHPIFKLLEDVPEFTVNHFLLVKFVGILFFSGLNDKVSIDLLRVLYT